MSRDIRAYFSLGTTKTRPLRISDNESPQKKVNGKAEKAIKKKKAIILDSDEEEDPLPPSPKRKKQSSTSVNKKEPSKTSASNLKPVNINDIFGKAPVQRIDTIQRKQKVSSPVNISLKKEETKRAERLIQDVVFLSDSSSGNDVVEVSERPHEDLPDERGMASKKKVSSSIGISSKKKETKGMQHPAQAKEVISDSSSEDGFAEDSGRAQKRLPDKKKMPSKKEVSTPVRIIPKKEEIKGVRHPARVMEFLSESSSEDEITKSSRNTPGQSSDGGGVATKGPKTNPKGERGNSTTRRADSEGTSKSPGAQVSKHVGRASKSPKVKEKESHPEPVVKKSPLRSSLKATVELRKAVEKEAVTEENSSPHRRRGSTGPETPQKGAESGQKPAANADDLDDSGIKRQRAIQYQKYLHREGPRNPGSKEIPKGHPNCLTGLTFVITGVLDSLDREDAISLVQQCGGKVTSNVSKNTSYIVLGDEPGPAKLEKAKKLGTKELTEDGLLDLVRNKAKEIEGSSPNAASSDKFGKRAIKEEEHESPCIPAKRQKNNSGQPGEEKKPELARKLAYLSLTCGLPLMNVAKGAQGPAIREEGSKPSSLRKAVKTEVVESATRVPSEASQVKSDNTMWVDKYKPTSVKQVIGQQGEKSNVNKLLRWLSNWDKYHGPHGKRPPRPGPWEKNDDGGFYKSALLSGPPGIGKTTSALLVCKELGMDAVELNASDTRSKKLLESEVSELIACNSLTGYFKAGKKKNEGKKKVLVMDEVDGMAGNEDRGGVAALIQLIKESRIPIICICNDRAHPKIRSLVNHCYDLRFQRPRMEQIRGAMMSICFKEGVKLSPDVLANLISSTNQDIRQVLHQLNMWSADKDNAAKLDGAPSNKRKEKLKDVRLGPWDVLRKVFSVDERRNTTINQQAELFFYDYNIGPLFVFENYPKVSPKSARNLKERLSLLAQTTESLAMGDIIQRTIRRNNAWKLLPCQAIFSSVLPGALMEGHLTGQIDFPAFLGKTSTKGKMERLAQEISLHTRVTARATKESIKMDYLSYLRNAILSPLIEESQEQSRGSGSGGVHIQEALDVMQGYSLLREDLDSILELTNFPGSPDPMAKVSSKVKSAFTRAYNKEGIMTPYAVTMTVKKKRGAGGSSEDFYGEEGEGDYGAEDAEEEEQEEDIDADAMIKIKKPSARGGAQGSKGNSGRSGKKDDATDSGKGKGRGKGASGGRGGKKRS